MARRTPTSPPSRRALLAEIAAAGDLDALERVRIAALGKKGRVPELMAQLGTLPADQRKAFGQAVNGLKTRVSEALEGRKADARARRARRPGSPPRRPTSRCPCALGPLQDGRIHPVSQVFDEVAEIFGDMGFAVAEGPDIETDDLNFTKLNIPPEHPARQEHDTFYMMPSAEGATARVMVLRTHTSPVQIRTMMSAEAADPHHRAGPRLPHRQRRHAHADVPPDRGAGDRRGDAPRPPQVVPGGVLQGLLRGRRGAHALPRLALPVHRAVDGGRHRRRGDRQARAVAGDPGLRHGAPQRASATAASIPTSTRASPSAWASTASPC